ncbi:MAG: hypothetical protein AAF152_20020 [Cyanobacteria bacterium P01_A01_bin.114]
MLLAFNEQAIVPARWFCGPNLYGIPGPSGRKPAGELLASLNRRLAELPTLSRARCTMPLTGVPTSVSGITANEWCACLNQISVFHLVTQQGLPLCRRGLRLV